MPYPILIAKKQKRPPLPFTERHQRHRHICSRAYLGSGLHFNATLLSVITETSFAFLLRAWIGSVFTESKTPWVAPRTPLMCSSPWLEFIPWDKARAGIKYKIPERSHTVLSSAVSLQGPTHPLMCYHCNKPTLGFPGFNYTDKYKFHFEELKMDPDFATAIGPHLELIILSGSTSFKY